MPIISNIKLPSPHIHRLNYFSSNKSLPNFTSFNKIEALAFQWHPTIIEENNEKSD
jgi:hypothetical protein